jgi:hypothetical protein
MPRTDPVSRWSSSPALLLDVCAAARLLAAARAVEYERSRLHDNP